MGAEVLKFDGGLSPRGFLGLMSPMGPRAATAQWGRSAARVQRVQRVLPACSGQVQRVVVRRLSGDEFYNFASRNKNHTIALRA